MSGTLNTNTTWSLAGSPYTLTGNVTVAAGVTLTIQPGVQVIANQFIGLTVNGVLSAVGTSGSPTVFVGSSSQPGWWAGIDITNEGSATLEYCEVKDCGYFREAGVYKRSSGSLVLRNCLLASNNGAGLRLTSGSSSFVSENNQFESNDQGVRLGINTSFSDTSSTFSDNSFAPVAVDGGTHTMDVSWELSSDNSLVISSTQTVSSGATLTLMPGLVLKSVQYVGIVVNGTLTADGTVEAPIYLTSHRDDTVGGDANNNADETAPAVGWWSGVDIQNTGSASFDYCTVAYSGYFNEAGIFMRSSGSLSLTNSMLTLTNGSGLRLTSGYDTFLSENNQFDSNHEGVRLGVNTSFSDTTSTFSNNSFAPVSVDGGTHTMDVSWELSSDYSLVISSTQTVSSGATLTLMPGLVLKSVQYVGIVVNGTLTADGTVEAPIYLTSHRDDTVGGDANNNADGTVPAVGWWSGIDIQNTGSASLDHCTVAYSGYFNEAGIFMRSSGSLSLTNSTLTFTNGSGLRLTSGYDTFLSEDNQFDSNHEGVRLGVNTRFSDTTSTYNNNSFAPVLVDGGTHTMDVSWELSSDFSIVINGTQTVAEGATLTLMPGLALKSVQFAGIVVRGMLKAEGTPEAPIYLTSHRDDTIGGDANNNGNGTAPFDGWWSGIDIQNTGSASFDFCTVAYSGYFNEAGIYMRSNGSLSLQNSTLKFTNGSGLRLTSGYAMIYSWNNRFEDNDLGVRLVTGASFSDTTSTFLRNSESQVGVDGGTIVADTVWDVSSHSAIILRGTVYVGADVTLTLKPGLIVKAAQYVGLVVDGTLTAQGTAVHPIIFTSSRDDSVGGDTNNDGDASVPSATWWSGLLVRDGGNATVEHCRIHYAGYFEQSGVKKRGGGDISLRNCTISNINGSGLFLDGATGLIDIVRCQFTDCDEGVFLRSVAQEVALVSCHYEGNSAYGVLNTNSGETDARSSWWGEASGPYHPEKNAEGLGDRVSDNVLFEPWRQTPGILDILSPTRSGSIVAGDTLRFLGSPLDSPLAGYSWNFGDGRTSNTRNPGLVTFSATGNFQVQYAVTNAGVPDPYPQIRELEVVANGGSHPDLSVTSLVVPSSIGIGQSVSIDYTVVNNGPSTLPSTTWTDRIYLSGDRFLDTPDTLLGSVGVTRSLAPGASYQGSLSVIVPPIEQGAHYLILSANDDWDAVELHRLNNEKPVSVNVLVPKLEQGVAFDGEFGAGSIEQYFRIDASGTKNLLVDFQKLEPNLTAYLRFGELPSRSMFDYRLGSNSLAVPSAAAGNWYVYIYGDAIQQAGEFSLSYDELDIVVTAVSPSLADSASPLELSLTGAGFVQGLTVELVATNSITYPADSLTVNSFTSAVASFGAGILPSDTYDLLVRENGAEYILEDAVEIVTGGIPDFYVDIISPDVMGYHQLATIFVEFGNRGSAPMQAPLLLVTALQNKNPGALMTLDQSLVAQGFWTSAIPKGFSTSVRLLASGKQPGLLLPGEHIRVPVYYAGWLKPWNFSYPPFEFTVVALTAQDSHPVPWALLETPMKLPSVDEDAWSAIWQNFTTAVGPTLGDLITTLSRNAVYLSRIGSEVRDIESLLAFELIKAEGLIGPLSELTGTVDLDVHRSQLTLQFARTFPRSIKQRYRKGPLGYGWNHTWEVSLAEQSDGTVILTRGNGATRVFQPDSRGGAYFSAQENGSYLTRAGGNYVLNLENGTGLIFDSSGRLDRMMDRYGSEILLHYSGDQLDRLSHSNGLEILLTYNGEGLIRLTEDSIGNQVEFEYDSGSHLVSAHHSQRGVTQYTYADSADLQKRHALTGISEEGNVDQTFGYDVSGRLATIGNALGNIHFTYQQGDVTSTDDLGHATQASFNHHGLLARIQDAESGVTTIYRDEESRTTSIRNADGTTMQTVRDRKGHIVKRINQDGQVWSYQTGNFGNIAKVVTPEGRIRSMDYDSQGNLTSLTEPDGSKIRFEYDALGRVTKRAMPSGIVETTTYNPVGLATLKAYSNGTSRQFEYDENNRLVKATNEEGDTSFTYDAAGNLTEVSYPNDLFISYDYDAAGRVTAVTDQNGRTSHYAYNAAGLLDEVTNSDETVSVSYMYDAAGRLAQKAFSSGARTVYERNGRGQITGQTTYDSSNTVLAGFSAEYNSVGLLSSYQTIQGNYDYRYDAVGRLVEMVHTPDSGPEEIQLFEHSPDGQLTSVSVDGVETAFTIDAGGRIAAIDGAPVTYDANGNVVSKGAGADNIDYQYDATGRVTEFTANTGSYQISYDALGTPLGIDAPSMSLKYLFDGLGKGMLYGEYDAAGDPVRTYHNGLGLAVVDYKGESYFPEFDPIKGETILSLSTTPLSSKMLQVARAGFSLQSFFPYLPPFAYDDFQVPMPGVYGWGLQGDAIEFASPYIQQAAQAVGFGVKDSSLDRILSRMTDGDTPEGGLMADVGFVAGLTGLFGGFNTVADGLARAANTVVVITDIPKPVLEGIEFLTGDNLGNVLGGFSLAFSGFEIASGVHETWSNGESVDLWEVANFATGSTEGGTQKIRHGMATGALTLLGMAAVGTAAAPVAAAAGIVAFISDNTIGLQEELYIWLTGLDVTGETLRGSRMSGSRDPNQKLGVSGYGPENYVAVDRRLTYRVDFENDSSASAPAQVVTIRDQLPDEVDWSTFEIVEVGFGDISIPVDPGTRFIEEVLDYAYQDNEYDFEVEVHIEVSIEDGEIFAIFYTLEPETGLPPPVDIGFLPPEVEKDPGNYQDGEGRGQGHLTYAVYPKTDLPTDTEIRNIATIQFDFSFNINTNQVDPLDASKGTDPDKEALVTIDSDIPQATVQALPALSLSEFQVNWNGQAASGIRNFDVYVRADGGAWNLWFSGTDQTQARFYGSRDANYEFYAVGTSNVGTSDPYSPAAQATTIAGIDDLFVTGYRAENGKMSISWIGSSGYQYQVQASGDLAAWENVGTVQTPTEAVEILSVVDDAYDFSSDRFYRVVILAESP